MPPDEYNNCIAGINGATRRATTLELLSPNAPGEAPVPRSSGRTAVNTPCARTGRWPHHRPARLLESPWFSCYLRLVRRRVATTATGGLRMNFWVGVGAAMCLVAVVAVAQ